MLRPQSLAIPLAITLCVFAVLADAKPEAQSDDGTFEVLYKGDKSPCDLARDMTLSCGPGAWEANSTTVPTKCSCNNVFFNIWSACILVQGTKDLPSFSTWGAGCKNASQEVTDGYAGGLDSDIPIWAFMRVPDDDKFNVNYVRTAVLRNDMTARSLATQWSTSQKIAPIISSVGTLVLVGIIVLLYRSKPTKRRLITQRHWFGIPRVHKVRNAGPDATWSIDQPDEIGVIGRDDAGSYRVQSPELLPHTDNDAGTLPPRTAEMHLPGKTLWKNSMQLPSRFPLFGKGTIPVKPTLPTERFRVDSVNQKPMQLPSRFPIFQGRAIPVKSVPPTKRFRIDSIDHSTLSGLSKGGSTEDSRRTSTVQFSTEGMPGGSSRAHETIEEESDEGEDASLISPGARSENHVFLISNRNRFTVGSRTSTAQSASHQVHIQPPTPTVSSHHSPPITKGQFVRPIAPTQIPPAPTQPAPSPPVIPPRVPPQLQESPSESQFHPIASTSQLIDTRVPQIALPILPHRPSGPLRIDPQFTPVRRQLSNEEYDPLHQRKSPPPRKPTGARQNLISPSSKESLRENAFSNLQYSAQAHQRQLSDSAARRSPLHWRDETYQGGASPPYIHRELSIEEEISRPTPSHHNGIAGPSSQLPRSLTPIPHRRGHSADDAASSHLSVHHSSPYSHTRNLSSETVTIPRSDPVNLFPGPVRAAGYPNSHPMTESSSSLYSTDSYPMLQPPNAAHHHRS